MISNPDQPAAKPELKPTPNADKPESKLESKPAPKDDLKSLPMHELMKKLRTSADGLTQAEAQKRQAQYGPNEITEKKTNELLKFLTYFWGPIPWMIEAAVILSALVQHWLDFCIILLLLCSNAVVGFWEEHQAGNAIAALKARLAINEKLSVMESGRIPTRVNLCPAMLSSASRRHRSRRCTFARWRFDRGRSVRFDWRVVARHRQARRRGLFRLYHPSGRNRRHGVCHRHEHLLW